MKKQVILILTCCLFGLLNVAKSQSIGLTASTTTVESGSLISFTATNENANKSISDWRISSYSFTNEALRTYLSYTLPSYNYYDASTNVAGKWNYRFVNSSSQPIEVTISFEVGVVTFVNGLAKSKEFTTLQAKITVNPMPPVIATRFYHFGTQVTEAQYNNIYNLDRFGTYIPGTSVIGPNQLKQTYYNPTQAAIKFGITDGGAAYELTSKDFEDGMPIGG